MKALALFGTVLVALTLQLSTTGAQRSLTLTSSVPFNVTPPPSLCPGSRVQFKCIAVNFGLGLDWERNGIQFQQYTASSIENETMTPILGLSVILNSVIVMDRENGHNVTFNSTVTAVVNEGVSSGDVITCGNSVLIDRTNLTANYTAIPPPPQPPNNLKIERSSGNSVNSVRLTIMFDPSFSVDNRVERYSILSQNAACPNNSNVPAGGGYYTCDGLEAGVEYNFMVRAVNCGNQESNETEIITITPQTDCGVPLVNRNVILNYSSNSTLDGSVLTLTCHSEYEMSNVNPSTTDEQVLKVTCHSKTWIPDPADFIKSCSPPESQNGSSTSTRAIIVGSMMGILTFLAVVVIIAITCSIKKGCLHSKGMIGRLPDSRLENTYSHVENSTEQPDPVQQETLVYAEIGSSSFEKGAKPIVTMDDRVEYALLNHSVQKPATVITANQDSIAGKPIQVDDAQQVFTTTALELSQPKEDKIRIANHYNHQDEDESAPPLPPKVLAGSDMMAA